MCDNGGKWPEPDYDTGGLSFDDIDSAVVNVESGDKEVQPGDWLVWRQGGAEGSEGDRAEDTALWIKSDEDFRNEFHYVSEIPH